MLSRVGQLADHPLDAAAQFHAEYLPQVRAALARGEGPQTLVFQPADYQHRGWRLSVVQGLAREYAPLRVNALASDDEMAIAAAGAYLETAEAVTGQYLPLDGNGAGGVDLVQS